MSDINVIFQQDGLVEAFVLPTSRQINAVAEKQTGIIAEVAVIGKQGPKGDKGDAGTVENLVLNEIPSGVLNGSNAVFNTEFAFIPESVEIFINGLKQYIVRHYQLAGQNIVFSDSPLSTDLITVNYLKA